MKRLLIGFIVGLAFVASACSSGGAGQGVVVPDSYTMHGTLSASQCGGGFDVQNATVTVRDQHDTLIGSGTTGTRDYKAYLEGGRCKVAFTVVGLPKASFYQVKVGTHEGPPYSFAALEAQNWHLDLTLS